MVIRFSLLFLLHLSSLIIQAYNTKRELNLNFQQNDYKIKFERLQLVRYNKELLKSCSIVTFKHNRTTAAVNTTFINKVDVNNFQVIIQGYKFMSNEYRLFPLHFGVNGCKALAANVAGIKTGIMKCGNFEGCPMLKNRRYTICNWFPDASKFPPYIPDGDFKIDMQLMYHSIEYAVVSAYATIYRPIV